MRRLSVDAECNRFSWMGVTIQSRVARSTAVFSTIILATRLVPAMQISKRTRKAVIAAVAAIYVTTWVGGWITLSREVKASAQQEYEEAQLIFRRMAESQEAQSIRTVRPGGPSAGVDWCIPLLPGVLLASSSCFIAPLWAHGSTCVILWYGTGTIELIGLWGWIS